MDETLRHHNPNPTLKANWLSKIFFWWMNPLFKTGYVRQLEIDDMYNVVPEEHSEKLGERLELEWSKEVERTRNGKRKPSLFRALFRMFGFEYIMLGFVLFLEEATKVTQPLLLGGLIRYFTPNSTVSRSEAFLYAGGVSLCAVILAISHHPYFFGVQRIGMKMRIACCSLIYRKSLKLSNAGLSKTTTGQIVNLMSNDVNRFDQAVIFLHFLWVGPVEAIAILAILWRELGPSTLAGFAVLLLLVPVQGWMGKLFSKFRQKTAKFTDERVRVMNEIIAGMRVIKMYCWEKPFGDLVEKIRSHESKKVQKQGYIRGLILGPFFVSIKLICLVVFLSYVLSGGQMRAELVFVTTAMFTAVRLATVLFMPFAIQFMSETKVTLKRLQIGNIIEHEISSRLSPKYHLKPKDEGDIHLMASQLTSLKCSRKQITWVLRRTFIAVNFFLGDTLVTKCGLVIIFGLWIALGIPMTSKSLYLLYPIMRQFTDACVFRMIVINRTFYKDLKVTISRIQTFLLLDELGSGQDDKKEESSPQLEKCSIEINNVTARWDPEVEQATLSKVSASVNKGKLLAVIGPVGAGKSSLLMAVLNELPPLEGSVEVKGRIAYVAQQPWVFSASLRQNITFGNKYDKVKYDRILKACALNKDVNIMPHGDLTLIGDRGVSLSGGQKARVSLARALYMDADVYLLDDPLSAVDASVGRHIFEKVIQGILKDKPRILVTHQLQYLKEAEEILILKEGEMIGKGTFNDLSVSGVDFASLLKTDDEDEYGSPINSPVGTPINFPGDPQKHPLDLRNGHLHGLATKRIRLDSNCSAHSAKDVGSMMSLTSIGTAFEAEAVQLPEEEERHEGTVGVGIYVQYFKAGAGILKFLVLAFLCLGAQCAYVMSDWWLSRWSNEEEARYSAMKIDNDLRMFGINDTNITIPEVDTHFNISVFSGIIAGVFLLGLLRALMFFKVAVDASQTLHNKMFASILRSHIGFFDTNPVGRVLNRFSKDIGHMDDMLPITFFDFVQCGLLIVGIVIVAGVVNPWVFIPVLPLIILFLVIRRYYLRTSRHIKRLEGTTRSPVFSHLSASLQGLQTIRAFGVQEKFVEEFDNHQDLHTEAWFLFLTASRWLAVRLDWLCAMFVAAVSFSCVFASESLSAGLVGLSMTYAMTLMGMFQWGVRQSAEVENQMISVERVLAYMNLPSEAPLEAEEKKQPPPDWPQNGVITLYDACLQYFPDSPLVLKNLNFTIGAREKIGIVGRTGAGKSSLITMLFRLVEPSGSIHIDDINIQNIGLYDLRKKISIIPQDPVLFTGTLRRNLDPFGSHSDDVLWKSLEEVQLKQAIEDLPHGMDTEVSEGGINFSVGQRQLICLARAILRNNRILMIDEATADVDPRTDGLIQQTIREKFNSCTVLTIAHRLNTIMDSDKLLLLDEGRVAEFDVPYILLQQRDSQFRKLVEQTGKSETMQLLDIAKKAYEKMKLEGKIKVDVKDVKAVISDNSNDNTNSNNENSDPSTGIDEDKIAMNDASESHNQDNESNINDNDIDNVDVDDVDNKAENIDQDMEEEHYQEDPDSQETTELLNKDKDGAKIIENIDEASGHEESTEIDDINESESLIKKDI